jgi:D-tyrosyl-tRNA(Tyr) deacylase
VRIVVQRVSSASVSVDAQVVGAIGAGLVVFVGVAHTDTAADAERLADKTARLRIFATGERPFDRSVLEAGGSVLCISQFTLLGDVRRGNRPSWTHAAAPDPARSLIESYAARLRGHGLHVASGVFGAHMHVTLDNDGPVTLILDTEQLSRARGGTVTAEPGG